MTNLFIVDEWLGRFDFQIIGRMKFTIDGQKDRIAVEQFFAEGILTEAICIKVESFQHAEIVEK